MDRQYIDVPTGQKIQMEFKENRKIEACPGVFFLFLGEELVYVWYSNDVYHSVTAMEHRGKNFDSWNYVGCFRDEARLIIDAVIASSDPVYNRPPEF